MQKYFEKHNKHIFECSFVILYKNLRKHFNTLSQTEADIESFKYLQSHNIENIFIYSGTEIEKE